MQKQHKLSRAKLNKGLYMSVVTIGKDYMIRRHLITRVAAVLAIALVISGCRRKDNTEVTTPAENNTEVVSSDQSTKENENTKETESTRENESSTQEDGKVRSLLTGEWIDENIAYQRPLAVMINNIEASLPQCGISRAEVIFEGQCEGGVTRLMAVFQDYDDITSIGSIRSCRDYFPFLAAEYDAAYFHFGQSDFSLEFLSDPKLRAFNGMNGEYKYVRRTDRISPHNVFTTPDDLVTAMVNSNVSLYLDEDYEAPMQFNTSTEPIDYMNAEKCITLKTGYEYNDAYFVYNENDGLYYRYEYGEPQIDEMTGEQLAVSNIIFKLVPGEQYWNGSPLYLLTGEGTGLYVTNGTAQWIKWSKETDGVNTNLGCNYTYGYGPTTYMYMDGTEITFNQGKTWICIYELEDKELIEISDK